MNIRYKIIAPLALGALLAAGCNKSAPAQPAAVNPTQNQTAQNAAPDLKFADQPYYKMSYLISGDALSADAKMALTGFAMNKQNAANGGTQITLTAQKTEYHNQQYTLRPGDQLYFIEKFLGDDNNEANEDKNMGDDQAVVVDSQGNVVGQPAGWTMGQ